MSSDHSQSLIELFYDGACPICSREVRFLKRRDAAQQICFTDIADVDCERLGVSYDRLMQRIHARLPDGSFVEGVEVFRHAYGILGFQRCVAVSRWAVVRWLLDKMYVLFARYRPRCQSSICER